MIAIKSRIWMVNAFFLLASWPLAQLKTSDAGTDLVDVVQNDS